MKSFWSSLHWRKSTSTPKFLSTAEAYFVCHIRPNFLHWVSVVRVQMYSFEFHILKVKILLDEIRGKGMTMIRSFSSCALNWPTSSFNILSLAWWLCSGRMQACWVCKLRLIGLSHSMARTNLNKSKNKSWLLLPQHQSTYPRGPESASIFKNCFLWSKSYITIHNAHI